jgi:phenylacetate-CoA ligase
MNPVRSAPSRHPAGDVALSVIAPCFNEGVNIDALADRTLGMLDSIGVSGELVLVDDGSADDTEVRIRDRSTKDVRVRGVFHQRNQGIEAAWCSGLTAAVGRLVCLIDADLQNRPEDIAVMMAAYRPESHDLIQAVRHPAWKQERCRVFTRGLNFLLNRSFGMRMRDNKSGFILCRREVLQAILQHRFHYRYFQSFIGVAAHQRGFTIAEVDTTFDLRCGGRSFLPHRPVRVSMRILWELAKFRVETWGEAAMSRTKMIFVPPPPERARHTGFRPNR